MAEPASAEAPDRGEARTPLGEAGAAEAYPEGSAGLGTLALDTGERIDFARLRRERRARLFGAMEDHDLDVLVLGREANARYASGARRLWTSGTRGFGPGCVVVRRTGAVHLLSTFDDGVPPEIERGQLYALTWNPGLLAKRLGSIDGLPSARRIGVDGMSPGMATLLKSVAPGAELCDATPALASCRLEKTPDELACIKVGSAVAEAALAHALAALRPGALGRELAGRALARAAQLGVTTPAFGPVFAPLDPERACGFTHAGGPIEASQLVCCRVGVLYAGYEGGLARTVPCPMADGSRPGDGRRLLERWRALRDRLLEACRPGRTGRDLLEAYARTGEGPPPFPVVRGIGLGTEPPVVWGGTHPAGHDAVLRSGTVLELTGCVRVDGAGAYLGSELVALFDDGPEVLTRFGQDLAHER